MSMILYDIRRGKKFAIYYAVAIFAACALILGFVAFWHYKINPARSEIASNGLPKVALTYYVPATYEAFDCLAAGPSDCANFTQYKKDFSDASVAFTYTAISDSSPGTVNDDGTRTVTLDPSLSDSEWMALGAAVTQDRTLAGADVNPDDVSIDGSVASAVVGKRDGSNPETARITFQYEGPTDNPESVRVTGVAYTKSEDS